MDPATPLAEATLYDLAITSLGYETRSVYAARVLRQQYRHLAAAGFPEPHVHRYAANFRWYRKNGVVPDEVPDADYGSWFRDQLARVPATPDRVRILVDVSSMSRIRIAEAACATWDWPRSAEVDFVYVPAKYDPPAHEEPPITVCQPVTRRLAGWSDEPGQPAAVVVGLGYERDKAVGALEYLEPGYVWGFVPHGSDQRYETGVAVANRSFWSFRPKPTRVDYDVADPFGCYGILESLAYGLAADRRPVIVPFGPKIFALSSVLVGLVHEPRVAIWRVSAGHLDQPVDRKPAGGILGIRLRTDNEAEDT